MADPAGLSDVARPGPGALSDRQRRVLRQAAAGHTESTIAARLHLSERTVRREIQDLCDAFGVNNRLALGIALGQLGLVDLDLAGRTGPVVRESPWTP